MAWAPSGGQNLLLGTSRGGVLCLDGVLHSVQVQAVFPHIPPSSLYRTHAWRLHQCNPVIHFSSLPPSNPLVAFAAMTCPNAAELGDAASSFQLHGSCKSCPKSCF